MVHPLAVFVMLAIVVAPSATNASDLDRLRTRGACSRVELAKAMGESPAAADKAACGNAPTSVGAATPEDPFAEALPPEAPSYEAHATAPDWLDNLPRRKGFLFGVGAGPDLTHAFREAAALIAAQMKAEVESSTRQFQSAETVSRVAGSQEVEAETRANTFSGETSKMLVRSSLADVVIEDQYKDERSVVHVLASLDVEALKKKEDALVASVLETLAGASERLAGAFAAEAPLQQEQLAAATSVLDDVDAFGRSEMGRQAKSRWRGELKGFRATVEKAVNCVTVDGGASAPLAPGQLRVKVTCGDKPLANARLIVRTEGGLTSAPGTVMTDADGQVRFATGSVFGEGQVRLTLLHDTQALPGSNWIEQRPDPRAAIAVKASRAATISFRVVGSGSDAKILLDALTGLASARWGARVVEETVGPQLRGNVSVTVGSPQTVQGQTSISVEASVVVASDDGTLFEKRLRAGSVARTESLARQQALNNLAQSIRRAK